MMITYTTGNIKFNYRVAGVILSKDRKKVLLNGSDDFDFFVLPGGRVELLEDSKFSLEREVYEELGEKVKVDNLLCLCENFFEFNGLKHHEINVTYLVTLNEDSSIYNICDDWHGIEQKANFFKWIEVEKLDEITLYPVHLKKRIKNILNSSFEHVIVRD